MLCSTHELWERACPRLRQACHPDAPEKTPHHVGAAAGCDLLIFAFEQSEAGSKDRSLRQLLQCHVGSELFQGLSTSLL